MKHIFAVTFLSISLIIFSGTTLLKAQERSTNNTSSREVAITFDDLPTVTTRQDIDSQKELTVKLLKIIKENKIHATGFVIGSKLYDESVFNVQKAGLLKMWLDEGIELGNHTFSHLNLNTTPLDKYEDDVLKCESVISGLLKEHGMKLRFFRHPMLMTGRSLGKRDSFNLFLSERGYRVAPVTIDNSDWIFARAYDNARDKGDKEMMDKIAKAYIPYMESKFEYYESQSVKLFGREIKQVLLVHANKINSEHFGELAKMMKSRGYKFISLEEALTDSAYKSPDTYIKYGGISWLHRWAITKGYKKEFFQGEPLTPEFVMKEAGVSEE